jgi:hypothetical protein
MMILRTCALSRCTWIKSCIFLIRICTFSESLFPFFFLALSINLGNSLRISDFFWIYVLIRIRCLHCPNLILLTWCETLMLEGHIRCIYFSSFYILPLIICLILLSFSTIFRMSNFIIFLNFFQRILYLEWSIRWLYSL